MAIDDDLVNARARTLALTLDLPPSAWLGPQLPIVNPVGWELGHVAWFQEFWILRHARGEAPIRPLADTLYDSTKVAHGARWSLPLPDPAATRDYLDEALARSLEVARCDGPTYFHALALAHEDMHGEAFTYTRQTLSYPAAKLEGAQPRDTCGVGPLPGDVEIPGCAFRLGAEPHLPFVFDNEKWAHTVIIDTFHMARAPVTNAEFAGFVEDGGYARREFWSEAGWRWRLATEAVLPVYWQSGEGGLALRRYDRTVPLPPYEPIIHVSWYEAEAYCCWAKRRLPTEAEWELAAATRDKRPFPWGEAPPTPSRANLDGLLGGPVDVAAFPDGDSAFGCRQMIGNVWEWTASDFLPYPGFVADPYKEYSEPWFASPHKVLRGGCWATRGRLLRNTWRNFYPPSRRDVLSGFRTCRIAR